MNVEIDFLPVGENSSGDAICVRCGDDTGFYVHVIDGGYSDTSQTVIEHILMHYGKDVWINHMVLSHADNDHACGLIGVLNRFRVDRLWMNRPWAYARETINYFHGNSTVEGLTKSIKEAHPYLVELEGIAARKGTRVEAVFQGTVIGNFTVLAPSKERYLRLLPDLGKTPPSYAPKSLIGSIFGPAQDTVDAVKEFWDVETLDNNPPATSASNETSLVQLGVFGQQRVLLTGDVGPEGLAEAARYAVAAGLGGPLTMIQVPHHGSRRNVTPTVLNAWLGAPLGQIDGKVGAAFVSVAKGADGYPRKKVKNAFRRRGYPVHATRGKVKYHYHGYALRPGWVNSDPEAFEQDVED